MATVFAPFDSYTVYYTAKGQDAQIAAAVIDCYDQGNWIGQIQFLPKSLPFTNGGGATSSPPNFLILYYSVDEFPNVYAIIRHEKPLAVWFDLDDEYGYVLTTDQEPVGDPDPQAALRSAREAGVPVAVQTTRVPGG
ncbi:MAG TPA: hypothetical protein VF486_13400 [Actinomycetes bacterium]